MARNLGAMMWTLAFVVMLSSITLVIYQHGAPGFFRLYGHKLGVNLQQESITLEAKHQELLRQLSRQTRDNGATRNSTKITKARAPKFYRRQTTKSQLKSPSTRESTRKRDFQGPVARKRLPATNPNLEPKNDTSNKPIHEADTRSFVVPYITGLGVNNQLWDFTAAAILAKATGRVLCLAPFLRFYLDTSGKPGIPFEDLLDAEQLTNYTEVADMSTCRNSCGSTLHAFYSFRGLKFPNKVGKELTHISSFIRNTGFTEGIPERPKYIDPENFYQGMVQPYTIDGIKNASASYIPATHQCIGVMPMSLSGLDVERHKFEDTFQSSPKIRIAAQRVVKELFGTEPYVAVHWRFEESKCRYIGKYLPKDRARPKDFNLKAFIALRKKNVVGEGELCFSSLPQPEDDGTDIVIFLPTVEEIANSLQAFMADRKIKRMYLATDLDPVVGQKVLEHLRNKVHFVQLSDVQKSTLSNINLEQRDVISRLEQEVCVHSTVFVGTSISSWTSSVLRAREPTRESDRFLDFIARDFIEGRLDKWNRTNSTKLVNELLA